MNASEAVKQYEDAQAKQDELQQQYDVMFAEILSRVKDELDALDKKLMVNLNMAKETTSAALSIAKEAVLKSGETETGEVFQFVWVKGKTTWDGKKLDGMADIIPELAKARKTGEPSVTVRKVK